MGGRTWTLFFELFLCALSGLQNRQRKWKKKRGETPLCFTFCACLFRPVVLGSVFISSGGRLKQKKNTSQRSSGCSAGCCNILTVSLYCFLKTAQRKTPHKSFFFAYSCQRMAPHLKVEYVLSFRRIKNCFFLYIMWLFSDCSLWSVLVHLSVFCSDLFTSLSGLVCDSQYDLLE